MNKSQLRKLVREHLRTRFMFEKDDDSLEQEPTPETAPKAAPTAQSKTPHEQAMELGLVDKKFGRYADPKTNKIVAKAMGDQLVRVEPHDAEEDRQAEEPEKSGYN